MSSASPILEEATSDQAIIKAAQRRRDAFGQEFRRDFADAFAGTADAKVREMAAKIDAFKMKLDELQRRVEQGELATNVLSALATNVEEEFQRLEDGLEHPDLRGNIEVKRHGVGQFMFNVYEPYDYPFNLKLYDDGGVWKADVAAGSLIIDGEGDWEAAAVTGIVVSGASPVWLYATCSVSSPSDFAIYNGIANTDRPVSSGSTRVFPLWELRGASGNWWIHRPCLAGHDIEA